MDVMEHVLPGRRSAFSLSMQCMQRGRPMWMKEGKGGITFLQFLIGGKCVILKITEIGHCIDIQRLINDEFQVTIIIASE